MTTTNADDGNKDKCSSKSSPPRPLDDHSYQLLDMPPSPEIWPPNLYNYEGTHMWHPSSSGRQAPRVYPQPYLGQDASLYYSSFLPMDYGQNDDMEVVPGSAYATPHGTIVLRLNHRMKVELTIDKAVKIVNAKNMIVLAINASGSACAMIHPNGRVHQYSSRVELMAIDSKGNNKYAKMWYKGVSFTSDNCALVYLVDSAGTRTTTDSFMDLRHDFCVDVFFAESRHGPAVINEAINAIQSAEYWVSEDRVENWSINGVRISQAPDGLVRVARNANKNNLRTSAANGNASISTPFVHCTASLGSSSHLFVRRGERRMHFDGSSFIVRNAGHSAGFDDKGQLKVY